MESNKFFFFVAHFGLAAYEMAGFGGWLLWLQKGWLGLLLYRCIYVYIK